MQEVEEKPAKSQVLFNIDEFINVCGNSNLWYYQQLKLHHFFKEKENEDEDMVCTAGLVSFM